MLHRNSPKYRMDTGGIGLFGSPSGDEEKRGYAKWSAGGRTSLGDRSGGNAYTPSKENWRDSSPSVSSPVTPTYSPLASSTRFNTNHEDIVRADAMSAGYVSRIAEAVSGLKVGQFPSIHLPGGAPGVSHHNTTTSGSNTHLDDTRPPLLSPRILLRAARPTNVKVQIASPLTSSLGILDKSLDEDPSEISVNNSTKTVIQVLKEISKKRVHIPMDDWSEAGGGGSKSKRSRLTEHNLCMSQLETSAQVHSPPSQITINGKRSREEVANIETRDVPKRARTKSYNYSSTINNEILSSLSSSVNITPPHLLNKRKSRVSMCNTPVLSEKQKKKHSRRSPTTPKNNGEDNNGVQAKQTEEPNIGGQTSPSALTEASPTPQRLAAALKQPTVIKTIVKAVDTSRRFARMINTVMPPLQQQDDTPQPPARKTEIVEKVVTRPMVNALLKSAITKFVAAGDASLLPISKLGGGRHPEEPATATSTTATPSPPPDPGLSSTAPVIVTLVTAPLTTTTTTSAPAPAPTPAPASTPTPSLPQKPPEQTTTFMFGSSSPSPAVQIQEPPKIQFGVAPAKSEPAKQPEVETARVSGVPSQPVSFQLAGGVSGGSPASSGGGFKMASPSMKRTDAGDNKPAPTSGPPPPFSFGTPSTLKPLVADNQPTKQSGGFTFSLGSSPARSASTAATPSSFTSTAPVFTSTTASSPFNTAITSPFTSTASSPFTTTAASVFPATVAAPVAFTSTAPTAITTASAPTTSSSCVSTATPINVPGSTSTSVFSFGSSAVTTATPTPASIAGLATAPKTAEPNATRMFGFGSAPATSTPAATTFGGFSAVPTTSSGMFSAAAGSTALTTAVKTEAGPASGGSKIFGAALASIVTTTSGLFGTASGATQQKSSTTPLTKTAPAFGAGGIFGSGIATATSMFGQKKEETGAESVLAKAANAGTTGSSTPIFGSTAAFGSGSLFGASAPAAPPTVPAPTATTVANDKPSSGGGFSYNLGSAVPFGSDTSNKPSFSFGASSAPRQEQAQTTGGVFAFGGAASAPVASSVVTTDTQNNNNNTGGFGIKSPPVFGSSTGVTFGSSTAFGLGGTPSFGSSGFGSGSGPSGGVVSGVTATGTTTAAGVFGEQQEGAPANKAPFVFSGAAASAGFSQSNKPFSFGSATAPTPAPPSAPVFTFGQPPAQQQQQQQTTGAFQFSATPTAPTTPSTANAGQQMFSIGSGSTAPRVRAIRSRRRP